MLVTDTRGAWVKLAQKEENDRELLARFVYPLIGLVALAAFAGVFFSEENFQLEYALKRSVKAAVSYFGGFHLAAYALNEMRRGFFDAGNEPKPCRAFTAYASAPMFALYILLSILPILPLADFFLLRLLVLYLYIGYIVWQGASIFLKIPGRQRATFTALATLWVVAAPELIHALLFLLMPGMRL
jgi:hypothetical protein